MSEPQVWSGAYKIIDRVHVHFADDFMKDNEEGHKLFAGKWIATFDCPIDAHNYVQFMLANDAKFRRNLNDVMTRYGDAFAKMQQR